MSVKFYHTIGDTNELVFRCRLDGTPYPLIGASVSVRLYLAKFDEDWEDAIVAGAAMTPDGDQGLNPGVARFDWGGADALPAFTPEVYKGRVQTIIDGETNTFPTDDYGQEYFVVIVNPAVPAFITNIMPDPTINVPSYFEDFVGFGTWPGLNLLAAGGSGAQWQRAYDDDGMGAIDARLGTSLSNRVDIVHQSSDINNCRFGIHPLTFATRVKWLTLPTALQNYWYIFGFFAVEATDPIFCRGVLFRHRQGLNGDRIQAVCRNDVVTFLNTDVDTGTNTINKANTLVENQEVLVSAAFVIPSPFAVETYYYAVNVTPVSFQLAATPNGVPIDILTTGDWMSFISTETVFDTGFTPVVGQYARLRIEVDQAGTEAQFFINGDLVARSTENIPVGDTKRFTAEINNDRIVGNTALTATRTDYYLFHRHGMASRV